MTGRGEHVVRSCAASAEPAFPKTTKTTDSSGTATFDYRAPAITASKSQARRMDRSCHMYSIVACGTRLSDSLCASSSEFCRTFLSRLGTKRTLRIGVQSTPASTREISRMGNSNALGCVADPHSDRADSPGRGQRDCEHSVGRTTQPLFRTRIITFGSVTCTQVPSLSSPAGASRRSCSMPLKWA